MITPLGSRVIIDPIDPVNRTDGGIYIPDAHLPKPVRGRVLSVGEGTHTHHGVLVPVALKEGDVVLYGKHSGSMVDIDGQEVLFLIEQEIFGVDRDYVEPCTCFEPADAADPDCPKHGTKADAESAAE